MRLEIVAVLLAAGIFCVNGNENRTKIVYLPCEHNSPPPRDKILKNLPKEKSIKKISISSYSIPSSGQMIVDSSPAKEFFGDYVLKMRTSRHFKSKRLEGRGESYPPIQSYDKIRLRADNMFTLCQVSREQFVQLGACSNHFLECSRTQYAFKKCPFHDYVFDGGVCKEASRVRACSDSQMNSINEETRQLAEKDEFCAHGPAIYRSDNGELFDGCSRQALICHDNRKDPISVSCPMNAVLTSDLKCVPAGSYCYGSFEMVAPVRTFFLERYCENKYYDFSMQSPAAGYGIYYDQECLTWHIQCPRYEHERPALIQCEGGQIYDKQTGYCRRWTHKDMCPMKGICIGREWTSVGLGECSPEFVSCYGLEAHFYSCEEGLVFEKGECRHSRKCQRCREGQRQRVDYTGCEGYTECVRVNGHLEWMEKKCAPGRSFNQFTQQCEHDRTCARSQDNVCKVGSSYSISCDQYMLCVGDRYEMYRCPPLTRWDPQQQGCIPDYTCRPSRTEKKQCRENDILQSTDCRTFYMCVQGQFQSYSCMVQGNLQVPCQHCASYDPFDLQTIPGQCGSHEIKPHESDCRAYYTCDRKNMWKYNRCPKGKSFDSPKNRCSSSANRYCSAVSETQCRRGERLVSHHHCDRFLECRHGRWEEMVCPEGFSYDVDSNTCFPGQCNVPQHNPYTIEYKTQPEQYVQTRYGEGQAPAPPQIYEMQEQYRPTYGLPEQPVQVVVKRSDPSGDQFCEGSYRVADRFDCSRFYECATNLRYAPRQCPIGSVFHQTSQQCVAGKCVASDVPANAECAEGQFHPVDQCGHYRMCSLGHWIEGKCGGNGAFVNGQCIAQQCSSFKDPYVDRDCSSGTIQPNPRFPNLYWVCQFGGWVEKQCPQGMHYDPYSERCVYGGGSDQPVPTPPQCYNGQTRPRGQDDCTAYEECQNGDWERRACEYGSGYHNGRCIPGYCNREEDRTHCQESSGVNGYRGSSHSCNVFYQCASGRWVKKDCPSGLFFNTQIAVCDWPRNVPFCRNPGQ